MATSRRIRFLAAAMLLAVAWFPLSDSSAGGRARSGPLAVIHVPIRWCALEGTTVVTDPATLGEPDTDAALLHRLQRASDRFWLPGAGIVFRSAMDGAVPAPASIPIIADPSPPPAGKGNLGDILAPETGDFSERNTAAAACAATWDSIAAAAGVELHGPIALAVQRFVLADGKPSKNPGQSRLSTIRTVAGVTTLCPNPAEIAEVSGGILAVADPSTHTVDDTTLVAHELGHLLGLRHGNGIDDDSDGPYDQGCDPSELSSLPRSLMDNDISVASAVVTDRQREDGRAAATAIKGATLPGDALVSLPACVAEPGTARPSERVTITFLAFGRSAEPVVVELGDQLVVDGALDAGAGSLAFDVPAETTPGDRLVSVRSPGSALSASCPLTVEQGG